MEMTVKDAINEFALIIKECIIKEQYVKEVTALYEFDNYLNTRLRLSELNESHITGYYDYLINKLNNDSLQIVKHLKILKMMLSHNSVHDKLDRTTYFEIAHKLTCLIERHYAE